MEYNRDTVNSLRIELGSLLQVENGIVFMHTPEDGIPMNIEFRIGGILIVSKAHNLAERFNLRDIQSANIEPVYLNQGEEMKSVVAIEVSHRDFTGKVYLEVEYPDFVLMSLKKMITDNQKLMEKEEGKRNPSTVLRELNNLFQEGIISEDEFNERKAEVLKKMTEL